MGKKLKSVGNYVAGGAILGKIGDLFKTSKAKTTISDKNLFDISQEIKPAQESYADLLKRTQATSQAGSAAPEVLKQMGQAALGRGPSLAEAQLKAAQDRNLAQQIAAVQGSQAGSSALGQRALLQNMGASGQQLAQNAAIARLGERNDFMNQANLANQSYRGDITGKLGIDVMPKQSLQGWEQARVGALNQTAQANAAAKNQMKGALLGGISSVVGGMATGGTGFFSKAAAKTPTLADKLTGSAGTPFAPFSPPTVNDIPDSGFMFSKDGGHITKANYKKQVKGYQHGGQVSQEIKHKTRTQRNITDEIENPRYTSVNQGMPRTSPEQDMSIEARRQEIANAYLQRELQREAASQSVDRAATSDGFTQRPTSLQGGQRFADPKTKNKEPLTGYTRYYEEGGEVDGPGTETSDSIPAMLSDGEFVIKASVVKKPGLLEHLEAVNSGKIGKKELKSLAAALQSKNKKGS